MMAQLVGYGGEEGVECVMYNASYEVTQQPSQPPQQTGHETGEIDTAEHKPSSEEIDTAPARLVGEQGTECVVYNETVQQPPQAHLQTAEATTVEDESRYQHIDTTPAADRKTAVVRKLSARDLQYQRIQETMYTTAVSQPKEDSPKLKEKCGDWCCFSAICINKIDYKTPVFLRARAMGWKIYRHTLFPLMGNNSRKFLVYSQLVSIWAALILSIISSSKGRNAVFDVLFLAVALIGSLLAAADAMINLLTSCHVIKYCCRSNGRRGGRGKGQDSGNETTEEPRTSDEEAAKAITEQRRKRTNTTVNAVDIIRIIVSELVLYPLVMCSIFKVILAEGYNFKRLLDRLSFVLLLISAASFVIYVYVVRIMIIIKVIAHTQRMRKPPSQDRDTSTSSAHSVHSISRSAKALQGYFVYHTIMQMLLQVVMVLAVAVRIRFEKEHIQSGHANDDIQVLVSVSSPLWFMMVGGYVLPYCGFLTFFIVTYHWVQEFPVGLCIDMITVLQLSEADPAESSQATCNSANSREKMEKIRAYFKIDELKEKFGAVRNSSYIRKLLYPFLSPTMVILCSAFIGLHIAFVLSIPGEGLLFPGSERVIFACFSTIANAFTFTVATIWIPIVSLLPALLVVAYAVYVVVVVIGVYFGCLS